MEENVQSVCYGITKRFIVHPGAIVIGCINRIGRSFCQTGMLGLEIRKMLYAVAGII